jgi:Zn finger protein HypA/HybF involved in hydrogenase expression
MEAYCLKCRTKREMKDEKQITMKNGKPATQGICPVCGTKMFKIGAGSTSASKAGSRG